MKSKFNPGLFAGAVLFVVLAAGTTAYNLRAAEDWKALLFGALIALGCGLVAIGADLQASVRARLGTLANTSILQCWQGCACLFGWGAFSVSMFQIAQLYPEWASKTFHFEVAQNPLATGLLVGVSAVIIIRSKLTKVNDIEWGAEWVYLWSGAQVLDAVNRRRVAIKKALEAKIAPYVTDVAGQPLFFTSLESHVNGLLPGLSADLQTKMSNELTQLRGNIVPAGSASPDTILNASIPARRVLVSVVIDYLGDDELRQWASASGLAL